MAELLDKALSSSDSMHLMNLVMQFRKVCNHPELFERSDTISPFCFQEFDFSSTPTATPKTVPYVGPPSVNPISLKIPKLLYRNGKTM